MAESRYEPVNPTEDKATDESSTSARLTPDSDSEDDEFRGLDQVEAEEGYELGALGTRKPNPDQDTTAGAEDEELEDEDDQLPLAGARRRRKSSVQSFELYTPDEERRVKRKLDTRLVLFVALLYMLSFLDRSNIGNAKVAGLSQDLKLSDDQFEWLLTAFYISYVLFEWMTLCYKIFPPHIYISCCVCACALASPVKAMTFVFFMLFSLSNSLIFLVASIPSMTGILISIRTKSNRRPGDVVCGPGRQDALKASTVLIANVSRILPPRLSHKIPGIGFRRLVGIHNDFVHDGRSRRKMQL